MGTHHRSGMFLSMLAQTTKDPEAETASGSF